MDTNNLLDHTVYDMLEGKKLYNYRLGPRGVTGVMPKFAKATFTNKNVSTLSPATDTTATGHIFSVVATPEDNFGQFMSIPVIRNKTHYKKVIV